MQVIPQGLSHNLLVGYDSEHLALGGEFVYERENQRPLPFNVDIQPLPHHKTVVVGSSSKENIIQHIYITCVCSCVRVSEYTTVAVKLCIYCKARPNFSLVLATRYDS